LILIKNQAFKTVVIVDDAAMGMNHLALLNCKNEGGLRFSAAFL
jgi:hypothetical protein